MSDKPKKDIPAIQLRKALHQYIKTQTNDYAIDSDINNREHDRIVNLTLLSYSTDIDNVLENIVGDVAVCIDENIA